MMFSRKRSNAVVRGGLLALALLAAAPVGIHSAEARAGGGFSFGSRGARTYSMPPSTATAPRAAQPFQRTETPASSGFAGNAAQPRRFGGFGTGLAAGLLGAGLFGMLGGGGFFGGLNGIGSLFGLLFQFALIAGVVMLAMRWFRSRSATPSMASGPSMQARSGFGGFGGGSQPARPATVPLAVQPQDFAAFEQALIAIQTAFSREDTNALSRLTTPEILRYFGADLDANRARGVRNDIADVKLLQGDLSEAWREGGADFATVAMRFDARDTMVDRTSGRVVDGNPNQRSEVAELWTFRRDNGGPWLLSAVQQTA